MTPTRHPDRCEHEPNTGNKGLIGECIHCGTKDYEAAALGEPFYRHMHDYQLADGDPVGRCRCGATSLRSHLVERESDARRMRARRIKAFETAEVG